MGGQYHHERGLSPVTPWSGSLGAKGRIGRVGIEAYLGAGGEAEFNIVNAVSCVLS